MLGTVKQTHRDSISWPTMHGGNVSKRNLKEFTIALNEKQFTLRRSASRWTKLAQEEHSTVHCLKTSDRNRKNCYSTLNKSGKNALMKLRSDFREAVTSMHRLHRESGEERPQPINSFYQYFRWHSPSASSSTSRWE